MGDDDIDEHAEAMDMVECPHRVQIQIACRNLENTDVAGKSDPYAIVYVKGEKDRKWQKVGRTETKHNQLDPDFDEKFTVNYKFERN